MGCSDSKNASDGVMVNRPSSIPHGLKEDHFDGPPQPPAALNALPHNLRARYKLGAQLGEGAYSVVRLGTSTVGDFQVAVKVVDRHNLPKDDENALRAEVEMLKELKHNNIVQVIGKNKYIEAFNASNCKYSFSFFYTLSHKSTSFHRSAMTFLRNKAHFMLYLSLSKVVSSSTAL